MASTTTTAAGVEVPQTVEGAPAEEIAPMVEGDAPAVEAQEVVQTDDEEEDPMSDDGGTSLDEQPGGEAEAAIAGNPTGATHEVRFDANCDTKPNFIQSYERTALAPFRDSSTAVGLLLARKKGTNPAEMIQLVAQAKLNHPVIVSRPAMNALTVVGTRAEDAQLKIALAAIAGKKAADKKVAAKARATKALEAANSKLRDLVATLEGKAPDEDQKAGIKAAEAKVAACALKLQRI